MELAVSSDDTLSRWWNAPYKAKNININLLRVVEKHISPKAVVSGLVDSQIDYSQNSAR